MPPVAGQRILIFGDSMSASPTSPGGQLAIYLQARGATTKISAVVGRSAYNFYTTRENAPAVIADALAFKPTLVIVQLGTNDIGLGAAADHAAMAKLRHELGGAGAEVWAIGPPAFASGTLQAKGSDAVVSTMRSVFGGRLIDWRPLSQDMTSSPPRTTDGIHFTAEGGIIAGQRLGRVVETAGSGLGVVVAVAALAVVAWAMFS